MDTPLIIAAGRGQTYVVEYLLQSGAEVSNTGEHQLTALHFTAQEGHLHTVRILLDSGANIESRDINGYDIKLIKIFKV